MKPSGRLLAVTVLLAAAALASAQEGKLYIDQQDTQCWDCHAPGLWDPPMNPNFEVVPLAANVSVGEQFEYSAEIVNIWKAEQLDMFVTLDISNASSLRFIGDREPLRGVRTEGTIDVQLPVLDPPRLPETRPSSDEQRIVVPTGATDLRIQMVPENKDSTTGPDLTMRVYNAFETAKADEGERRKVTFERDETGNGGTETVQVTGISEIAAHGYGNWTVEAEVTPIGDVTDGIDPQHDEVPYTIIVDAWFNTTGLTKQIENKPGPVAPQGGREIFTWQLAAESPPQPGETVRIIANVTTYYNHQSASDPDEEDMRVEAEAPVRGVGSDRVQVGTQTTVIVDPVAATGVSLAAIGEAVGYASGFLLLASIWTGGMFGKGSRRQLNSVFGSARRRVAFHNFLSYGIIAAAIAHMVLFIIEVNYHWLLGFIWGGTAILAMLLLGVTGALQVPMIRRWNYATWRWIHFGLAIAAIVFTLVHMFLDGQNFSFIQDAIGYKDPLVPANRA